MIPTNKITLCKISIGTGSAWTASFGSRSRKSRHNVRSSFFMWCIPSLYFLSMRLGDYVQALTITSSIGFETNPMPFLNDTQFNNQAFVWTQLSCGKNVHIWILWKKLTCDIQPAQYLQDQKWITNQNLRERGFSYSNRASHPGRHYWDHHPSALLHVISLQLISWSDARGFQWEMIFKCTAGTTDWKIGYL